jgi:group I intron endonuclease
MTVGIYCIENIVNGKKYIGQSTNLKKRMWEHHNGSHILNGAIKKYGKEGFKRYILVYCEIFELERLEIECIKIFHSHKSEWGYNISWGGKAFFKGRMHSKKARKIMSNASKNISEEKRKLLSIASSGKNNPNYGKTGKNSPNYGKSPSEETRKLISNANLGKRRSEKTKKLMSELKTGTHPSDATRMAMSIANSGKNNPNYGKTGKNNVNFGKKRKNASSQYFGVISIKNKEHIHVYWRCQISKKYIGTFKIEINAARAYDKYIFEHGLPNPLNFPEEYS